MSELPVFGEPLPDFAVRLRFIIFVGLESQTAGYTGGRGDTVDEQIPSPLEDSSRLSWCGVSRLHVQSVLLPASGHGHAFAAPMLQRHGSHAVGG